MTEMLDASKQLRFENLCGVNHQSQNSRVATQRWSWRVV
jgi:hypothetical protein